MRATLKTVGEDDDDDDHVFEDVNGLLNGWVWWEQEREARLEKESDIKQAL